MPLFDVVGELVDTTSKTGVYCEALLIEAGLKRWRGESLVFSGIIKNIQPISVGV